MSQNLSVVVAVEVSQSVVFKFDSGTVELPKKSDTNVNDNKSVFTLTEFDSTETLNLRMLLDLVIGVITFRSSSLSSLENNKSSVILLATYRNGYFREWDLVSGQVVHTIFTHQKGGITYLCVVGEDEKQDYNHDKLVVLTGARDGSVKCWARNIHYPHSNESTPSNNHNNSNDSSSSQPHKFRWDLLYTIPGRPNYAITCIATKIIKKDSIGILVTEI
ncbi:12286_t:CDS:2 [Entrophospora sp. SA101]|nr:12286_t:CDS:2 [Entrophospora sp. SA101]